MGIERRHRAALSKGARQPKAETSRPVVRRSDSPAAPAVVPGLALGPDPKSPLYVGGAHDAAEHEADLVAERAVATLHGAAVRRTPHDSPSTTGAAPRIGAAGGALPRDLHHDLRAAGAEGHPLSTDVRRTMEHAMGAPLSPSVRVHAGPGSKALNEQLSARAFTVADDVYFRDGLPDISSAAGTHLLAHELAHTRQRSGADSARRTINRAWQDASGGVHDPDEGDAGLRQAVADHDYARVIAALIGDDEQLRAELERLWRVPGMPGVIAGVLHRTFEEENNYSAADIVEEIAQEATDFHLDDGAMDMDTEMDDLTERFARLQISPVPFEHELSKEPHQVLVEQGEIIVRSNPVPISEIVTSKRWGSIALTKVEVDGLAALQASASSALLKIAGHAKSKIKASRTKTNMVQFMQYLQQIAKILAGVGGVKASGFPATVITHTGKTEGLVVRAAPLSLNSTSPGAAPSDGRHMKAIRSKAGVAHRKAYKQMHLLNDLVFGPNEPWNLVVGPTASNNAMERNIEHHLKSAVLGRGVVVDFTATVDYGGNDPNAASLKEITDDPAKYVFKKINFEIHVLQYNASTGQWERSADLTKKDPDIKLIHKSAVHWSYGKNLPSLVTKPKILVTTDVAALCNGGISAADAARIVAFNAAGKKFPFEPGSHLTRAEQLAAAIKKWEKETSNPKPAEFDGNWNSKAFLWSR